jgi:hypothetical protein
MKGLVRASLLVSDAGMVLLRHHSLLELCYEGVICFLSVVVRCCCLDIVLRAGNVSGVGILESNEEYSPEESPIIDTGLYIDRNLRQTSGEVSYSVIKELGGFSYSFTGLYSRRQGSFPSSELPRTLVSLESGEEAVPEGAGGGLESAEDAIAIDRELAAILGGGGGGSTGEGTRRKLAGIGDVPRGLSYNRFQRSYVQPRNRPPRVRPVPVVCGCSILCWPHHCCSWESAPECLPAGSAQLSR